jgi:hypothetical protein
MKLICPRHTLKIKIKEIVSPHSDHTAKIPLVGALELTPKLNKS